MRSRYGGKGLTAMYTSGIIQAWGKILRGEHPALSIEITRECPLRCPGCYAYEDGHLGGGQTLRQLIDHKGQALVDGVLEIVDRLKPLHLSIVGGDPLVRYRELELLLPQLFSRGIHVQVVTSAFRALGAGWADMPLLHVAVSIDGLQPEHDARRAPATYERILKNIAGQNVTLHCTVTGQMMKRPGYLAEFLIRRFSSPPQSPEDCVFAQTTRTLSADLTTEITPCQFGGKPDCGSCGCVASMGLAAVAAHKLGGFIPVGAIFNASIKIGRARAKVRTRQQAKETQRRLGANEEAWAQQDGRGAGRDAVSRGKLVDLKK